MVHSAALEQFRLSAGRGLSLVDWTIVLASRVEAAYVFTFDSGFAGQGVATIPEI
jgi:hypothetical protein